MGKCFVPFCKTGPNTATDPCAGVSRPCAVIMPEAMVDGEMITEEDASGPGWIDTIRRQAKSSTIPPASQPASALAPGEP
ncbi:hypothetical protein MRX96_008180 [Rhipicephalus microplus]